MKNYFKKIHWAFKSLLCFLLIFSFVLSSLAVGAYAENLKHHQGILSTFYNQEKNTADVVFIGSSAVYRFVSPAQMYSKYGITALNYAAPGLDICTTPGLIREVVNYQHPKLIVIELRSFIRNCERYTTGAGDTKKQLLNKEIFFKDFICDMPASASRSKVISDTVTRIFGYDALRWEVDNFYSQYKTKNYTSEQLQSIITKNYSSINKKYKYVKDASYKGGRYKGTVGKSSVTPLKQLNFSKYTAKGAISESWLSVLYEIINEAKACGTKVMFMTTPCYTTAKKVSYENTIAPIIAQNGFRFFNCNKIYKKIGLDFSYDFYDVKHTNISGMVKFTNFIGKYIINKYNLKKSKLNSKQKAEWKKAADLWIKEVRTPVLENIEKYKKTHKSNKTTKK